jgi:bifunctional non-homologous end joining protein LigD
MSGLALALPRARKGALPSGAFEAQLAKLGEAPPEGDQWLHEFKWDGYRILTTINSGEVRLWSRNAIEWTDKLPAIVKAIDKLGLKSARLDGELIAGSGTKEDFNLLQSTLSGDSDGALTYTLFDILYVNGVDVSRAPLLERKALLKTILRSAKAPLAFSDHIDGDGAVAYKLAVQRHFEGIISKRADLAHQPGRSDDWRKTKNLASDEFAVVGYTQPQGSRTGFGSLLLAKPDTEHGWRFVGRVGSGFSDSLMRQVVKLLAKGGQRAPTAYVGATDTDLRSATWFAPRFVVEVFYRGMGRQQLLRQPSLKAVREDKEIADLNDTDRGSRPGKRVAKTTTKTPAKKVTKPARKAATKASATQKAAKRDMPTLSSPDKVLFPDIQATKQDVWNYYEAVADLLLPEIKGRPLSLIRCPSGIVGECFFQRHHTAGLQRVATVNLEEESGEREDYLVVENIAGLMELVQFNVLEFHPWGTHATNPERADRVIFDLDPGPKVPFSEVKKSAADIRKLLAQLELESFLRVSGGKGLHVVVPLNPGCDWDLTKRFAQGFAHALAQSQPERFVDTASKKLREKRIFIDYLRNGRSATAVASYSLRARPGAPVAMPLAWNDLSKLPSADAFTMEEVPARLRRRRMDPWEGINKIRQNLAKWSKEQ